MCSRVRSFDRFFVVSAKHLERTAAALMSKDEGTNQLRHHNEQEQGLGGAGQPLVEERERRKDTQRQDQATTDLISTKKDPE